MTTPGQDPANQGPAEPERVEAILRRYGVPEADIGDACTDLAIHTPTKTTTTEYGVQRRWGMEWGGSVGMTHNDPYTADSVFSLADGNPVYRRTRTIYQNHLSQPERLHRPPTQDH